MRRRGAEMGCSLKAVVCVLVTFYMVTTVAAPPVAAAVQKKCSAVLPIVLEKIANALQETAKASQETAKAWQEIAKALNSIVERLANKWSFIVIALCTLPCLLLVELVKIPTGVCTQYLVDRRKEAMPPQNDLEAAPRQVPASANEVVNFQAEVVNFQAEVVKLRAKKVKLRVEVVKLGAKKVKLRVEVVKLRAELAAALNQMAMATADAARKEEETNKKGDWLDEVLRARRFYQKRNPTTFIWPLVDSSRNLTTDVALRKAQVT